MTAPGGFDRDGARLPREVVLASAGTGKTFTLSSRMIGLLARGAPADTLLAATFTRKAAGEILDRVLTRLARAVSDEEEAGRLAEAALLGPGNGDSPRPPREVFSEILPSLVRDLHRVSVGTLDSFFVRVARCFPEELGLPPGWAICDEPTSLRLEEEALQAVLSAAGPREMVELVRMAMRGESGRGVHRRLLEQLQELRELLYQRGVENPETVWEAPAVPEEGRGKGESRSGEEVLRLLEAAPVPTTAKGEPNRSVAAALEKAIEDVRRRDWGAFCGRGLVKNVLAGDPRFGRSPLPAGLVDAVQAALGVARIEMAQAIQAQIRALRTLVLAFDDALTGLQAREGAYRFKDLTFLLGGVHRRLAPGELWYRLDQRARHLLLDEFQDTSRAQWQALEPLAEELLASPREDRSAVVVADPKQSIYGWRGAEPELVGQVARRFALHPRRLDVSYRSSRPVLDSVNRVFSTLPDNPVWRSVPDLTGGVDRWWEGFPAHTPARDLPGFVSMEAGPAPGSGEPDLGPSLLGWAAERIRAVHLGAPAATVGVLVRRNATVARLIALLHSLGVDASEEGATSLAGSPAVAAFLALLRLADHPGDTVARYHVAHSPLGALLGLEVHDHDASARRLALELRGDLLALGYGPTLLRLVLRLGQAGTLGTRDLPRVFQLVELGHRWDERRGLRPRDFVRYVESEALEAPSASPVRVMTVHKAKGLEFDAVILPELDQRLLSGRGRHKVVVPLRDPASGKVLRIFPRLAQEARALFPELEMAARQDLEGELLDSLGVLYVALTRPRHALHLLVASDPPERKPEIPFSYAGLMRSALGAATEGARTGDVLYEDGDREWATAAGFSASGEGRATRAGDRHPLRIRLGSRTVRGRMLPHLTPTEEPGAREVLLPDLLALSAGRARAREMGAVIHSWLESLEWLEDWRPDWPALERTGRELAPSLDSSELNDLRSKLIGWLESEAVAQALSRRVHPLDARMSVRTEVPFAVRLEGSIYQGRRDRVVTREEGGKVVEAEVLDFKTDALDPGDVSGLAAATRSHLPQMRVYRRALGELYRLSQEKVRARLVFLPSGRLVDIRGDLLHAGG